MLLNFVQKLKTIYRSNISRNFDDELLQDLAKVKNLGLILERMHFDVQEFGFYSVEPQEVQDRVFCKRFLSQWIQVKNIEKLNLITYHYFKNGEEYNAIKETYDFAQY